MKYLVKNRKTGEETLCEKVEVDGFDYYTEDGSIVKPIKTDKWQYQKGVGVFKYVQQVLGKGEIYEIIATNNKSLDLPQVVDEVDELAKKANGYAVYSKVTKAIIFNEGYHIGYQKAKETYNFTKEDMIDFVEYINLHYRKLEHTISLKGVEDTMGLIDIWQQQRTKTIIVE